LTYIDRNKS